jgi:hypothetical protein
MSVASSERGTITMRSAVLHVQLRLQYTKGTTWLMTGWRVAPHLPAHDAVASLYLRCCLQVFRDAVATV